MLRLFLLALIAFFLFKDSYMVQSQEVNPVQWAYKVHKIDDVTANIQIIAHIEKGWDLYDMHVPPGGPLPTVFHFEPSKYYGLKGNIVASPKPKIIYDDIFQMDIGKWKDRVVFSQQIEVKHFAQFAIPVRIEYMVCNDVSCVPLDHSLHISIDGSQFQAIVAEHVDRSNQPDTIQDTLGSGQQITEQQTEKQIALEQESEKRGGLAMLWLGFLAGLLALLTPCVWPVVPMTVSYFISRSVSRRQSIKNAMFYALSVIVIYVTVGLLVSMIFGPSALGELASSPGFNLFFFALLVIFAISFFGAFEIRMPSGWVNKLDQKSEQTQNIFGVFFMALTLVLVSFSCTGPIIGWLLVEAASATNVYAPLMGMLGFSIALALPFSLLVLFPGWLKSMPRSGGWMNSIKVVLAFLMLAFSLRFFSVADMVAGWNLMPRELFVTIWIVIFMLLGFYLLGKIRFSHDSEVKHISIPRLFFSMTSFVIALLLLPGLWGAPLKLVSGFMPPLSSQNFVLSVASTPISSEQNLSVPQQYKTMQGSYGLTKFLDYEQGLEYAQQVNKPILLYFTAHSCSNCKKMEASVFGDPQVLPLIKNKYVFVALYVDDRETLPANQQYVSKSGGSERKITTWGKKWSDMQISRFRTNALPYFVLLDKDGHQITEGRGYTSSAEEFAKFLSEGFDK